MWLSIKIKRTDISTNPLFDHLVGTTATLRPEMARLTRIELVTSRFVV